MELLSILLVVILAVIGLLIILFILARMFQKVGPDEALIIYGIGGNHVVTGGGRVVWPLIQTSKKLSLELMSFDVIPSNELYTNQGVAVMVEAVAQIKVKDDPDSITTASIQFLNKTEEERQSMIRLVMEGHLRGIVGTLTVEQIVKEPEMVQSQMLQTCAGDLIKMGLEVRSFTIKNVKDGNDYIVNMGKPEIARIKKEAAIAEAIAFKETEMQKAVALREAAVARAGADQERVLAQTASEAKQAEFTKDMNLKKAAFDAEVAKATAEKERAYDIRNIELEQTVTQEKLRVQQIEREGQIKVQEAEIIRKEKELIATVLKETEAEQQKIRALAEAEKARLTLTAAGRAEALRSEGLAQADAAKAQGLAAAEAERAAGMARADVLKAQGLAEAEAVEAKAKAYQNYSQAAILDKLLAGLPELAKAVTLPLEHVDKITVLSTGGANTGLQKVTQDVAQIMAQAPELVEGLTGISVGDWLKQLKPVPAENRGDVVKSDSGESSSPAL
ncbi:Flotillin, C-terminal domain protein [Acididesulfobacillus acetoxydans]|uniref:Flotillin, C-terminal domain protein n=1 Tax=Acididesulfobacillus acetoxydans TaxID=1561005 RepID=A0A8S0WWC2_9FIRM|nr:flotillin family protein [Acididesulfobacillus acetoxydans]CAA7600171.1 Flotillin, C-terminal domain protein [Acididesulfobacillus acetoxydans]CEJ09549.1 Flotillin-1 [Acididesulfobacillus acetoxydans]